MKLFELFNPIYRDVCVYSERKKYSYRENIFKNTLFFKSKYYPVRNESSNC